MKKVLPWSIFFASSIFFLSNLDFATTGDSIYYANIIDTLRFDHLTVHQAYYLTGLLFKQLLAPLLGLPTDHVLAVMSALFGAAALSISYLLIKLYLKSEQDALIGVFMLFLCHRFYTNATSAEIYVIQAFFIWSSYLLFEKRHFYLAGIAIAMAIWITPLTITFCLVFPVIAYLRGYGVRSLFKLSISVTLIYLPFLFFFYEELLWGARGLMIQDSNREMRLLEATQSFFKYQIKHYSFLNLLLIPALFAIRREKLLLWISLTAALPNIYVISQLLSEDNVFILALDIFFVSWFVIGWREMRERSLTLIPISLLIAHLFIFLIAEQPFIRDSHKNYSSEMKDIGRIVQQTDNAIIVMNWGRRLAFVYYNRDSISHPLEQGYWYDLSFDIGEISDKNMSADDFKTHTTLYLLEHYSESIQARIFLSEESLNKRYEEFSDRRHLERQLDVDCRLSRPGIYDLYRCD